MTTRDAALEKVKHYRDEKARTHKAAKAATHKLHEWITKARDAGCTSVEIAAVAGVTREMVTKIAPVAKAAAPRSRAQKKRAADSRADVSEDVPTIAGTKADTGNGLSGIVTARNRRPYGKATMFYRDGYGRTDMGRAVYLGWPDHENSIGGILKVCQAEFIDVAEVRVYVTGATPAVPNGEATKAEAVREWALSFGLPGSVLDNSPWRSESHYLADPDLPVLRFKSETGQRVTIMRAASWWGETDTDVDTSADAWRGLERALHDTRGFAGTGLADTPATSGRALWQRTIGEHRTFAVQSTELRELIAATSGQGRIELLPASGPKVPGFTYMDGRFMYGSLCWGLPVDEPTFWTGAQLDGLDSRTWTKAVRGRGRWRITMTVPDGWHHVGLFAARDAGGAWRYPCEPGETFTTWADGCELWNATVHGWEYVVHEGFTWNEGKPLDLWMEKLLGIWKAASAHKDNSAAQLAARAVRSMVITSIGAFATRAHNITRTAPLDEPPVDLAAGTEVRRVGDRLVWEEPGRLSGWSEEMAHPEWSSTIWARARVRLLDGKGVNNVQVGALHLPREQVLGFHTDALYLASDPEWRDDGAPGRFRVKGRLSEPAPWPQTYAELHALRDKAEAAL